MKHDLKMLHFTVLTTVLQLTLKFRLWYNLYATDTPYYWGYYNYFVSYATKLTWESVSVYLFISVIQNNSDCVL